MNKNIQRSPEAEPLGTDIGDVDISYPVLLADIYVMNVQDAKVAPNKKGTGNNLAVTLQTTQPAKTTKGHDQPAGLLITYNLSMTPTEKYTQQSIDKSLAKLAQWAGVRGLTLEAVRNDPAILIPRIKGVQGSVKIGVQKESDEYPESNSVKDLVIVK